MTTPDKPLNPFEPSRIDSIDSRSIQWENQDALVRNCQIIVAALSMGVISFAAVALSQNNFQVAIVLTATTISGIAGAGIAVVMSFLIPAVISSLGAPQSGNAENADSETVQKTATAFQVQLIIGCALLEGACFFNIVLYQVSNSIFSLVAMSVCLALLLTRIPTKRKIQAWIAKRL